MTDVVWWLVGTRAVLGTVLLVLSLRVRHLYAVDRISLRLMGVNGIIKEILSKQVIYQTLRAVILGVFTFTAWLSWPFVHARGPYPPYAVWVSSMFLFAVLVEGLIAFLKWRERITLMRMARTISDGGSAS